MPRALATLLHISDLHIGDIDPTSGDATLDAHVANLWRTVPIFQGYLGHTHRALAQLADLWKDVLETESNPHVIVTGDITATGAEAQYATATAYLERRLYDPQTGVPIGLDLAGRAYPMIPGNHDHWPGKRCAALQLAVCMLGPPHGRVTRVFGLLPLEPIAIPLTSSCRLVVAGLNSDADVGARSIPRLFARGSFETQCGAVLAQLGLRRPGELRVLLVHHSAINAGTPAFRLRMEPTSRAHLAATFVQAGIAMVLTGHQHTVDWARQEDDPAVDIREARCGTTTARDYFAPGQGSISRRWRNTAMIHRLFDDEQGGICWDTEVRARLNPAGPFEPVHTIRFGRVWP